MNNLSSHALFHFTQKEDTLQKILLNGLRFSPIGEKMPGSSLMYTVDAVCFCNIPLSAIKHHVDWYGLYGIGFTPTYCKSIGATPVCYAHANSTYLCRSRDKLELYSKWNLTPYIKRICGIQSKYHCKRFHWKEFYDEKEWRAIKQDSLRVYSQDQISNLRSLKQTVEDDRKSRTKTAFSKPAKFSCSDIEYIILPEKRDVSRFINWMNSHGINSVLHRKIITVEEIIKDF